MDIHKPKPWHGAREFLKEYAIIVVGVLTALAAEQGVEWLHWRHVAAQTEASLRAGVNTDVFNAIRRIAQEPCMGARNQTLAKALASNEIAWRGTTAPSLPGLAPTYLPQAIHEGKGLYARTAWDIAVAQGGVLHMPADKVNLYANIFRNSGRIEEMQATESDLESRLGLLAYDGPLSREQRGGLLTVLQQLDSVETRITALNESLLRDSRTLKIPRPADIDAVIARNRAARGSCIRDVAYPGN